LRPAKSLGIVGRMMREDSMTKRRVSEAEELLLSQSDDLEQLFFDFAAPAGHLEGKAIGPKPKSRSECIAGVRPCPWVTCRHHLFLDVRADGGIRENFDTPETMLATCSLDLAEDGPRTLDQVSVLMGMSRERVRQIEESALVKLRYSIRRDDAGYAGTETEAADGIIVRQELLMQQAQSEAQRRRAQAAAEKEARKQARGEAARMRASPR
jgi:hypothetical protein